MYTKTRIFLLLFCFFSVFGYASDDEVIPDSIISKIDTISDPADRNSVTVDLMRSFVFANNELSHAIADYHINWAISNGDDQYIGKAYSEKAILYLIPQDYDTAKPYIRKAIHHFELAGDDKMVGYANRNLGVAHFFSDNIDSSIVAHYNGLAVLDRNNEEHKLYYGLTCEELGKVYYESTNLPAARKYAKKAIEVYREIQDSAKVLEAMNLIVLTETNPDSAFYYLDSLAAYYSKIQDSVKLFNVYANYGKLLIAEGRIEEGKRYSLIVYDAFKRSEEHHFPVLCVNLSAVYLKEGNLDSAMYYLDELLPIAKERDQSYVLENAYANLMEIESQRGNYKKALEYSELYFEYHANNLGLQQDREIKSRELELELVDQKRALELVSIENEMLANQSEYQFKLLIYLGFGLVLLSFLVIYIWRTRRQVGRKNLQLSAKNDTISHQKEKLENLLENNKNLFSIIAHDLRSPVASIKGALDLIPGKNDEVSDATKRMLTLSKESSLSVLELLENLLIWAKSQQDELQVKTTSFNLREKLASISSLYKLSAHSKNIEIKLNDSGDLLYETDIEVFDTIIRNLLSNAVKFSPKDSAIIIDYSEEGQSIKVEISDEAGGLDEKQANMVNDRNANVSASIFVLNGLGLKLVKNLIAKLNGTISYQKIEKGSKFILTLPKKTN